jgi:hypothetical protein
LRHPVAQRRRRGIDELVGYRGGDPCPNGKAWWNDSGSGWDDLGGDYDMVFRVFVDIPAPTTPAGQPTGQDPKCNGLRKKLKHQNKNLGKAETEAKRSMIRTNIAETKRRLKKLGC